MFAWGDLVFFKGLAPGSFTRLQWAKEQHKLYSLYFFSFFLFFGKGHKGGWGETKNTGRWIWLGYILWNDQTFKNILSWKIMYKTKHLLTTWSTVGVTKSITAGRKTDLSELGRKSISANLPSAGSNLWSLTEVSLFQAYLNWLSTCVLNHEARFHSLKV